MKMLHGLRSCLFVVCYRTICWLPTPAISRRRDKIAQDHIRHQRQDGRRDQQFQREDSRMNGDLVNRVQERRDDKGAPRPSRTIDRARHEPGFERAHPRNSACFLERRSRQRERRRESPPQVESKAKTHRPAHAAYEIFPAPRKRFVQHNQLPVCNRLAIRGSDWKTSRLRISAKFIGDNRAVPWNLTRVPRAARFFRLNRAQLPIKQMGSSHY